MIFSRRLITHLTAYIAMFAMVMLFGAPIISKHLQSSGLLGSDARHDGRDVAHSAMTMPGMDHSSMHGAAAMGVVTPSVSPHRHDYPAQDSACDYCELLIHVPLFLWVFTPELRFVPFSCWRSPSVAIVALYLRLSAAFHMPRAPPRVSVGGKSLFIHDAE
ncbi:DUF2946 domain-containing protein [Musicola keenii]|uniref:DUF2946 domain-containing protein n=1 Tax=Musicola keenii TaxID=2884250 RepID=UPI00177D4622|nr:DUF2946 domain-containing protein [Musicola keenii]